MLEITENFNANKIRKVKSKNTKNAENSLNQIFILMAYTFYSLNEEKKKHERKDFSSQ